ncbi:Saccharopine dehydrogenase-domain-containing protein [Daldinia bambusicola]|nr:Saccharopine dehydrogenase-domain-containing protein [Daldinia bambusicola]
MLKMFPPKSSRKYDILLLGASGYTGILTAQHIAANFPTNLKWAISGTSSAKLKKLADQLKKDFPDRTQPEIEIVSVDEGEKFSSIIEQARVCISSVFYAAAGEQVVRACVEGGTDYVDCAAIASLLYIWFRKYHQKAQENEVALIHACGALITPLDIICWLAVQEISSRWSLKTKDATLRLDDLDTNLSGGTVRTVLTQASLNPKVQRQSQSPSALSVIEHPLKPAPFSGLYRHPRLGLLAATSVSADQDRAIIYRSWSLLEGTEKNYGPRFEFNEYEKASSVLGGIRLIVQSYILSFIMSLARIGPIKNFLLSLAPEPGNGPSSEVAKSVPVSMEVLATADWGTPEAKPTKFARVNFLYTGGHYPVSAMFMAEAAASLLYSRKLEGNITGGCLTPAILGSDFVERTRSHGAQYTVELIEED